MHKSHGGKRKGAGPPRLPKIKKKKSVTLSDETIAIAKQLGGGELSGGIDKLFVSLPLFTRVKVFVQMICEGKDIPKEEMEYLLTKLEELEIDFMYEEAQIEGLEIRVEPGAYIL